MAGKGATLAIRIVSDASGAAKGFEDAESRVGGFQKNLDRASIAAAGVLAGVGALAKEAYDAASAMQQSSGAVESVFGAQAQAVKAYAAQAAESNGLAASAYQDSAALIGSQLKSLGFPIAQAADQTDALIDTAADLAATFGGTTQEAVDALSSALKGERDPIERYGISLSQAAIDAKVAALGLDTSTDASKRNADAQAALAIVADQSAAAQGSFAREADTAAGQTQRASAEFENAKAALGDVLLPIVTEAAQKFSTLTQFLVENKDTVLPLIGFISGLAAAVLSINGAVSAYRATTEAWTVAVNVAKAAQFLWNLAMTANPIGAIVLAVTAAIAVVVLLYNKFDAVKNIIDKVVAAGKKVGNFIGGLFGAADAGPAGRPAPVVAARGGGGTVSGGLYGAAVGGGGTVSGGLFGAASSALAGGGSTAGQGSPVNVVNVTVNGALDPVAVGRQLVKVLKDYGVATGGQVSLTIGGRTA